MAYVLILNGREVSRKEWNKHHRRELSNARRLKRPNAAADPWRHHESTSTSVPRRQVEQFRSFVKDQGLTGVEIQNDGTVKISSMRAQRKWLKARGYYNVDDNS